MADTNSIFYKIGQATKSNVANAITALKAANNTWTGTNDFNKAVTVGTDSEAANLTVKGGVSSTGAVSGNTVSATGAVSGASLSTSGDAAIGGNATITGNLTVSGTTTTISSNNLDIKDNIITLNDGAKEVSSAAPDAGLLFERADGTDNAAFLFEEDSDRFEVGATVENGSGGFGTVSLGALAVNSLLVGTRASTQALGDLADFNAGLSA